MARPENPMLAAIEDDQADIATALLALGDLARLYGELDEDAALNLVLTAFKALKALKSRARTRHETFSTAYHDKAAR